MNHSDFKKQFYNPESNKVRNKRIGSIHHYIYTIETLKEGLSSFDNKRIILNDNIHSYSFGHKNIKTDPELQVRKVQTGEVGEVETFYPIPQPWTSQIKNSSPKKRIDAVALEHLEQRVEQNMIERGDRELETGQKIQSVVARRRRLNDEVEINSFPLTKQYKGFKKQFVEKYFDLEADE